MNYLTLNILMLIPALLLVAVFWKRLQWRSVLLSLLVLVALTAIFDNLIVGSSIVSYDERLITGIKVGLAPVEDFFYTVFAALVIPIFWKLFGAKK